MIWKYNKKMVYNIFTMLEVVDLNETFCKFVANNLKVRITNWFYCWLEWLLLLQVYVANEELHVMFMERDCDESNYWNNKTTLYILQLCIYSISGFISKKTIKL